MFRRRASRSVALVAAALAIVAAALPVSAATPTYRTTIPFAGWEIIQADIAGIGTPRPGILVKAFSPGMDPTKYLAEAAKTNQKVVLYFTDTVDYSTGTVYPGRVKAWVDKVKAWPNVYAYLSVKEPSWSGISLAEMRSLYKAYKAADPNHRVAALLGDTPHFGMSQNPWGTGVADTLWVDWYPVTYSRGYIGTASTNFPKIRSYVNKVTPGTNIWLMVQGHGYKTGDKRTPTNAELDRQVRDGLTYLKADGIVFYTWKNPLYTMDLARNPTLWAHARWIISAVRAGTF